MDDGSFEIFAHKVSDVIMPHSNQAIGDGILTEEQIREQLSQNTIEEELISKGINEAISSDTVKSILIDEELTISLPNYVIDMSNLESIAEFQMEGIQALLNEDGDTVLYINTQRGLLNLGKGNSEILDRIISVAINNLFDGQCNVYRNFAEGKELELVDDGDLSTRRLSF